MGASHLDFFSIVGDPHDGNGVEFERLASKIYFSKSWEVLGLYRKREQARRVHVHGVFARFRYNDLKEAARGCGGRGPYGNSMVGRSGMELCRGCAAERDT